MRLFYLLFLLVFSSWRICAQGTAGSITGQVTDSSGAPIPQATIRLSSSESGLSREVSASETGIYVFTNVLPASYDLTISANGFKNVVRRDVVLPVNASIRVDISLPIGDVTETINVTEAAAPILETTSAKIGSVVETKQITELPLNGRQFAQLILLTPGAVPVALGQSAAFKVQLGAGSYSPVINGQRSRFNTFSLDGIENNDPMFNSYAINPSVDAIQEFTVQSRGGAGEQGRSMGSDIIVVTRSGTNRLKGSAWEFLRNQKLDARNFFDPTRPDYKQNQFGGTLGGAVRLPGYDGHDKTFFFGYFEGFRSVRSANNITTVPTDAMRNGDFSAAGIPAIYDIATTRTDPSSTTGYTRNVFPGNRIPTSRIDANAASIFQSEYPLPNLSGVTRNYINTMGRTIENNQGSLRLDHKVSENNNLFGRLSYNSGNQYTPLGIPVLTETLTNEAWNGTVSDTHIFQPNLIGHFQVGANRYTSNLGSGSLPESILSATGWDKVYPAGPPSYLVLGLSVSDVSGAGGYVVPIGPHTFYQSIADVTWIKGRHTLKAGFNWNTLRSFQASPQATIAFDRRPTSDLKDLNATGYGPTTFLLGLPTSARRAAGDTSAQLSNNEYHGFLQDEFRLHSRFTITLGLRYSYVQALKEARNAFSGLDYGTGNYLVAGPNPVTGTAPNVRERWVDPDWNNFAPRIGLAWLATPKTTIRAGAGIYYSFTDMVQFAADPAGNWPYGFSETADPLNNIFQDTPLTNPFVNSPGATTPGSPQGQGGYSRNPRLKTPYSTQWNFSVQRQLPWEMLAEASYVGSNSVKMWQTQAVNRALPGPGAVQPRRRWPDYGGLNWDDNGPAANYNGLSIKLQKRFSGGHSFLISDTWSHSLDIWSTERGGSGVQDPNYWRADYASSTSDIRNSFLLSNVFELPFGKGRRHLQTGIGNVILGGWQWSNIFSVYSGRPVNVTLGFDNANNGGSSQRPNLKGNPVPENQTRESWIRKDAFAAPAVFTFGNAGRNILRGPSSTNLDVSLIRTIPLGERQSLQFRGEFFNILNIVNFGLPDSNFSSNNFGVITSAGSARSIQFALKLSF